MNPIQPIDRIRRCVAHCRGSGKPCNSFAIKGGNVCRLHGGTAPQVKAKAAQRLAALLDPDLPLVAQRIKQGLYAMETKLFQKDGIVTDKRNLVNWSERRASAELAMKAMQIVVDKDAAKVPNHIEVNITVIGEN